MEKDCILKEMNISKCETKCNHRCPETKPKEEPRYDWQLLIDAKKCPFREANGQCKESPFKQECSEYTCRLKYEPYCNLGDED